MSKGAVRRSGAAFRAVGGSVILLPKKKKKKKAELSLFHPHCRREGDKLGQRNEEAPTGAFWCP